MPLCVAVVHPAYQANDERLAARYSLKNCAQPRCPSSCSAHTILKPFVEQPKRHNGTMCSGSKRMSAGFGLWHAVAAVSSFGCRQLSATSFRICPGDCSGDGARSFVPANGTHYPLDVNAGEDRCRVRHPVAATTLGILRRAVQGEARAWARRQPRARDRTCPTYLAKMSRRRGHVIRLLTRPVRL